MRRENKKNNEKIWSVLYTKHGCRFQRLLLVAYQQNKSDHLTWFLFSLFSIFGKYRNEIEILEVELNFYAILFSNMSS